MGIGIGLATLLGAGISAASAHHTQAANAAAQSELNRETMDFNRVEAEKAREWQANQDAISRIFNASQSNAQRSWASQEATTARNFDSQQSLLARQFEERMSSTAHQREVNDLKMAGLNPILSATGGNGASTPSVPVVGAPMPSGSAGTSSSGHGAQAAISRLNAYMKKDVVSQFVNSALDGLRVQSDLKKAEAADKQADAAMKQAVTNDKKAVQEIEESISRVGLNYDQHELNQIRKRGEEAQAKLFEEKIISEVQDRLNKKQVSDATVYNLRKCAEAAGTAAYAQARIAEVTDRIQSAESPERISKLRSEAEYFKGLYDKNKWIMEDPKSAAQRKWWRENPEAAHANEMLDIIGNVVHGSVGIHGGN